MPKPPILETIDWNAVYDSGVDFDTWLTQGETEDHVKMMKDIHENQVLDDAVLEQLSAITKPASVIAIAEDWCPDVVRHAPILQKICDQSEHLNVRYLTRETGKDIFVRFLTNGGEAIPKFVFLSDQWVECGNWGP
jgi:thiol-disulfide isomerase/thioredoxin